MLEKTDQKSRAHAQLLLCIAQNFAGGPKVKGLRGVWINLAMKKKRTHACMISNMTDLFKSLFDLCPEIKKKTNLSWKLCLKKNVTQQVCLRELFKNLISLSLGINYCSYDCF